jgi:hypothetical protein
MASAQKLQVIIASVLLAVSFTANAADYLVREWDPDIEDWVVVSLAGEEPEQATEKQSSFSAFEEKQSGSTNTQRD